MSLSFRRRASYALHPRDVRSRCDRSQFGFRKSLGHTMMLLSYSTQIAPEDFLPEVLQSLLFQVEPQS